MGLLIMLLMLAIMFIGLFRNGVDETLSQIFTYFPFTAPTMIMLRLGLGGITGTENVAALGIKRFDLIRVSDRVRSPPLSTKVTRLRRLPGRLRFLPSECHLRAAVTLYLAQFVY
jgi:hypothetical protein